MSAQNLLNYIGAVTGILGAITGIAGAIMGYISYRRSGEIKALDLRLELRKLEREWRTTINELPSYLEQIKKSHAAVASATGLYGSGAFKAWCMAWEEDMESAKSMLVGFQNYRLICDSNSHAELEATLADLHIRNDAAKRLHAKYTAVLASDDREREHIRADTRAITAAKLTG